MRPLLHTSSELADGLEADAVDGYLTGEDRPSTVVEPKPRATGLTLDEYDAACWLHDHVDSALLRTLSNPSVTGTTVDAIAKAITNRTVRGSVLISGIGRTSERDALPSSGRLPRDPGGCRDGYRLRYRRGRGLSVRRSTDSRIHIGDVLDKAFSDVGSAGGHREMAGGEVPLGIFADDTTDDAQLVGIVEQVMTARLVAGLNLTAETETQADVDEKID